MTCSTIISLRSRVTNAVEAVVVRDEPEPDDADVVVVVDLWYQMVLQWALLNGITVNGIIWVMGSNLTRFISPNYSFVPTVCF